MKFVLASQNQHKIKEMRAILSRLIGECEVLTLKDVGIYEDIVEDGDSFEANALIKAKVAASTGYIGIADDSGLVVEALNGAPGIYSARYAGEHGNDKANNDKLLKELQGEKVRRAAYICSIACVFPDGSDPIVVRGRIDGEILCEPRGDGGFGYDPLFWIDELGKTMAEITEEEKNAISHRSRALIKFAEAFNERYNKKNSNSD